MRSESSLCFRSCVSVVAGVSGIASCWGMWTPYFGGALWLLFLLLKLLPPLLPQQGILSRRCGVPSTGCERFLGGSKESWTLTLECEKSTSTPCAASQQGWCSCSAWLHLTRLNPASWQCDPLLSQQLTAADLHWKACVYHAAVLQTLTDSLAYVSMWPACAWLCWMTVNLLPALFLTRFENRGDERQKCDCQVCSSCFFRGVVPCGMTMLQTSYAVFMCASYKCSQSEQHMGISMTSGRLLSWLYRIYTIDTCVRGMNESPEQEHGGMSLRLCKWNKCFWR